jgi:hypothetical protein
MTRAQFTRAAGTLADTVMYMEQPVQRRPWKLILLILVLIGAAFLGGYIPSTLRARAVTKTLQTTELDLRLANLHRRLGVAAEEAQRNNYASAAEAARGFFDGCATIVQSEAFADQPRTRIALSSYAGQREDIMTQLAMANPQVRERLASMYLTMDGVLTRRQ